MDAFKSADGTFTVSLVILVVLMVVASLLITALHESKLVRAQTES